MNKPMTPGRPASHADLRTAQERYRLLSTELPRVRTAAIAWRNALGGLLVTLIGFGLIRGRSDISDLADAWAATVGIILLASLIVGAVGALSLVRAAHGQPSVASIHALLPRSAADHVEALASANALRRGIWLTLTCASLLVAAVGTTWYGPTHAAPSLQITTPAGTVCGSVVRLSHGALLLTTADGEINIDLTAASAIRPLSSCPPA